MNLNLAPFLGRGYALHCTVQTPVQRLKFPNQIVSRKNIPSTEVRYCYAFPSF